MTMKPMKYGMILILVSVFCMILSFLFHSNAHKMFRSGIPVSRKPTEIVSELQAQVNQIFSHVDQMVPKVNVTHKDNTSCAQNSIVTIVNPKERYCVGDKLIVQVDMFDYLRIRKNYGGDYLKARIFTPKLGAAASGKIEDFKNGTYHIHFTLFWEGEIVVSVFLIHPSEGISAVWSSRNRWYGYIEYKGKFTMENQQTEAKCGFERDNSKESCEYADPRDEEYFYCEKPLNYPCNSLTDIISVKNLKSNLTEMEKSFFEKSNTRVEIPKDFGNITTVKCNKNTVIKTRCKIGMNLEYPSGYFMKNIWNPHTCSMQTYRSMEEINKCIQGKFIYIFGDSTLRQWMEYFQSELKTLTILNRYEGGWAKQLLGIDPQRNIMIRWKRHASPFITTSYQSYKEERTIPREIDLIGGHQHTVIVLNIGVHFRSHPLHHYIRRLINIRKALERLFIRSPQTKVIIKSENSGDEATDLELMCGFHGYVQYLIMEQIFKDLNVGFVNGWDMTTAFDYNIIHPPRTYVQNEVDMLMTYIC
ncbi:NXPE family member 4-like [Spea bombifrons]|uniref:NXPE family member 4-like n=1 Tax=Spea bombifrons TaxID=233779 RepID=UPI00234B0F94|nr:NXPE family member 4-like [Spea bombifrons]